MSLFSWFHRKRYSGLKEQLDHWEEPAVRMNDSEREIVRTIRNQTEMANRNNITRTMAYLDFYTRNQDMDWALLAHLVSRNAGWNMTDLKGEWCARLLNAEERGKYFLFMERANWLIFQDAYPQLLLYEQSQKMRQPLFHLLPSFHVSCFMQVVWRDFWEKRDRTRLTVSLIINEQNYIELRVIDQNEYSAPIFGDIKYFLEDVLDLCMILFPADSKGKRILYGRQVNSFPELKERIQLGKDLYGILFSPEVFPDVFKWCTQTVHTGSRADYWPEFFGSKASSGLKETYQSRMDKGELRPGAAPIFSPKLEEVWKDHKHEPAMIAEWYKDHAILDLLALQIPPIKLADKEYKDVIQKMERAVLAKQIMA